MSHIGGLDLGFGNMKFWDSHGPSVYASHASIATGPRFADTMGEGGVSAELIEFEEHRYYTGLYASQEGMGVGNLGMDRLLDGMEIRALFYGAISQHMSSYAKITRPIAAQVGLPAELLQVDKMADTKAKMERWMIGQHEWKINGVTQKVAIESVNLVAQAAAAAIDYGYSIDGKRSKDTATSLEGTVGIISIGYNTIELFMLDNMKSVPRYSASDPHGVRRLLEILAKGDRSILPSLDLKLRENRLNGELEPAIRAWKEVVAANISGVWGRKWKECNTIILVGGGASILRPEMFDMFDGKAFMPDRPIESIARGLYKRGVAIGRKAAR